MTMKKNEVLQFVQDHDTFLITYYAKTHKGIKYKNGGKIITRKGTWTKPNSDTQGKVLEFGQDNVFVYWDLDAEPNENGNRWRKATNPLRAERIGIDE